MIGCWHVHAADYARAAQAHPETELVRVWDDDPDRGDAFAREFGIESVPDLDALLSREDLDGVLVTAATVDHRDVMIAAAQAGKHIFTEKLLAPTVDEAEEIIATADKHGVTLIVSLPRLSHGYTQAILDVIDSEALGQVNYARVRLSHDGASTGWLPERFFDPRTAIGGALTDLGCHPAYLVQLFLGLRPDRIVATYRSVTGQAVEDHAVVVLGYPGGMIGVVEAGFLSRTPFLIELYGTRGGLSFRDDTGELQGLGEAFGGGPRALDIPADSPDPFAQWVGHIRAGSRGDDNLLRAVELTRLVTAANEVARAST